MYDVFFCAASSSTSAKYWAKLCVGKMPGLTIGLSVWPSNLGILKDFYLGVMLL